jgi:uncharacterized protein YkwD
MKLYRLDLWMSAVLLASSAGNSFSAPYNFQLGEPPVRPKDVSHLPVQAESLITGGFSVATTNREEVRSFYNAIYPASDNAAMNSTANTVLCFAGSNSGEFNDSVLRRINWFRAMAGLAANVTLNSGFNASNQLAALMMSANTNLSHTPPPSWNCFTLGGSNAANSSNIALGTDGPDAVTGYIQDPGGNNTAAGHRRWLLYPQTQIMGTGDVPQQGNFLPANAIWVFDGHLNDARPATRNRYVAWPSPGFVPKQTVYPRWSFACTNADFSNASINMTSNGVAIAVSKEIVQTGFGENTMVWVPMGLDANDFQALWPFNGTDTIYTVAISNVLFGATASNFNYSVTVFDPAVPGAGYFPPVISGPGQPLVGVSSAFSFSTVSNSTSYQWRYTRRIPFSLADGAETGTGNFTPNTSPEYSVITTNPVASGSFAFQLAHTEPDSQILALNYTISPLTNASLTFKSRLAGATSNQTARVQVSTNGGGIWSDIYTQAGSEYPGETGFSTRTMSLGNLAGASVLLRFNYDVGFGTYYPQAQADVGWHFDDITISNAEQLLTPVTNAIAGANFQFNPPQAGNYNLEARGVIFTDFPLDWGPTKQVLAVTTSGPVITINKISVSNNQTKVDFALQSGSAATYKLLTTTQPSGTWSTDTVAVLSTNAPGSYRFTTTPSNNVRFYRIQTP